MKKQEILDQITAGENSRVESKFDELVRVTGGKTAVKIIPAIRNNV